MFSKSSNSQGGAPVAATGAKHTPYSIIGGDVVVTGDIEASIDLHIDGKVEGDIRCAALVQGADSRIKGHVTAKSARIGGHVEGSLSAEEIVVEASARIVGDVTYNMISIAPGGQVAGLFSHMSGGAGGVDLKLVKGAAEG